MQHDVSAADSPSVRARNSIGSPRAAAANSNTTPNKTPTNKSTPSKTATNKTPALTPKKRGRNSKSSSSTPQDEKPEKAVQKNYFQEFYDQCEKKKYNLAVQIFQYLQMRELAAAARVCKLWKQMASNKELWRHVRMKNSQVNDWKGLCSALKRHGTVKLDLRKMLLPQNDTEFWDQFTKNISSVNTLEQLELCRCPARVVEKVCQSMPKLKVLGALAVRDNKFDPTNLKNMVNLTELRLKSMSGFTLTSELKPLENLRNLKMLSLTSAKDLGKQSWQIIGSLRQIEILELGECCFGSELPPVIGTLTKLTRLRLERVAADVSQNASALLKQIGTLPLITHLELVNFDVKVGFDEALGTCTNLKRLLIIPTYVAQSATTNKQVLSGVLRLKDTLSHLMWGVTIELLKVTELFIDQCEQGSEKKKVNMVGECIPVLKPVPGLVSLPQAQHPHTPQVEILPLPSLQKLLSTSLPQTKLKLLRIPFHATWRQSLADFN